MVRWLKIIRAPEVASGFLAPQIKISPLFVPILAGERHTNLLRALKMREYVHIRQNEKNFLRFFVYHRSLSPSTFETLLALKTIILKLYVLERGCRKISRNIDGCNEGESIVHNSLRMYI